jgi:DNA-binding transcriptional ArsR family regulator
MRSSLDHSVHDAVGERLVTIEVAVAIHVGMHALDLLAGVLGVQLVDPGAQGEDLTRVDLHVGRLAFEAARGLVDEHPTVGQHAGAVFEALSDPVRRRLLSQIATGPATATELASGLPISRQAVAKHLSSLSSVGLLARERSGRNVRYRITPEPLSDAVRWMTDVGGRWDDRLARLAESLGS